MLLPSLDRLAALIERVVELVDALGGSEASPAEPRPAAPAEPPPEPPPEGTRPVAAELKDEVWVAFVPSPHGYRLLERRGGRPDPGQMLELDDGSYRVLRLAPSPLPGDKRRCAFVEREEPRAEDRTLDA